MIVNRSEEKSELLAKELGLIHCPPSSIEELEGDIVINTTSVGMFPDVSETPFSKVVLKKGMTVMDIVYRPLWTRFLQEAEQRGCVTIDGLEMLVHQGAAQLEIWTGKKPEIGQIKEDLRQAMKREESHD